MKRFVRSPEGQELAMLCLDLGYKLADRPGDLTRPQINFLALALSDRVKKVAMARADKPGVTRIVFTDDDDDEE